MGLHENYHISQALDYMDEQENYYYQRELEEQHTAEQAERYEQVYELDLNRISDYNIWHLRVKMPTFFDAEFTKYFNTLDEVQRVTVSNDYCLIVQLKTDMEKENSEDLLYCAFDNVKFAIDDNCRENLYTLPF